MLINTLYNTEKATKDQVKLSQYMTQSKTLVIIRLFQFNIDRKRTVQRLLSEDMLLVKEIGDELDLTHDFHEETFFLNSLTLQSPRLKCKVSFLVPIHFL